MKNVNLMIVGKLAPFHNQKFRQRLSEVPVIPSFAPQELSPNPKLCQSTMNQPDLNILFPEL